MNKPDPNTIIYFNDVVDSLEQHGIANTHKKIEELYVNKILNKKEYSVVFQWIK